MLLRKEKKKWWDVQKKRKKKSQKYTRHIFKVRGMISWNSNCCTTTWSCSTSLVHLFWFVIQRKRLEMWSPTGTRESFKNNPRTWVEFAAVVKPRQLSDSWRTTAEDDNGDIRILIFSAPAAWTITHCCTLKISVWAALSYITASTS